MQTIDNAVASEISFNEGLLRLAAVHKRAVEFRYSKSQLAPVETRRVYPTAVVSTDEGHTLILANDDDREDIRAFRLDRIKGDVWID